MNPLVLALGAIGLFGLFGGSEVHRYERDAARDLSSMLGGPSRKVAVTTRPRGLCGYATGDLARATIDASLFDTPELPLFTEPDRPKDGRLGRLELRLHDFTLAELHVESLSANIPSCRYDLRLARSARKIRLSESGEGEGQVLLSQDDLAGYAAFKYPFLKGLRVRLLPAGLLEMNGVADMLAFQAPFEASGRLALDGPRKIILLDPHMSMNGWPVDAKTLDSLLGRVNPLIDLDRDLHLHGAMDLTSLEVLDGFVQAWGIARVPVR